MTTVPSAANRRLFVVLNPVSGSCDAETVRRTLLTICQTVGVHCDIHTTAKDDDPAELTRKALAEGYDAVVAAGGDGTACQVANGLLGSDTPMAILPVGTANLLARELHIPLNLSAACQLAVEGKHCRAIDIMQSERQLFLSHVSIGTYSRIAERTTPEAKRRFRQLAYVWNAIPELFGRHAFKFKLNIDGQRRKIRAAFIMIANVGEVGAGPLRWGPDISPDDGRVNLCIVRAGTVWDYLRLIWHVVRFKHHAATLSSYMTATDHIYIRANKRLPVRGDGEIVGTSPLELKILRAAIRIVVPEPDGDDTR